MQSPRTRRQANGPQLEGHATHIQYERDSSGNPTARRFTDPDGQRWISKMTRNGYTNWRFAPDAAVAA